MGMRPHGYVRPTHACDHCGNVFLLYPGGATRFCSRKCKDVASRRVERRDIKCEHCSTTFNTKADHGVWPQFCSRTCFLAACDEGRGHTRTEYDGPRRIVLTCEACGAAFERERVRRFCSVKCRQDAQRRGMSTRTCLGCGCEFPIRATLSNQCCSKKCAHEYYTGARSKSWNGGKYVVGSNGDTMVRLPRPGYVGKYTGEHRIVASRAVGRMLLPHEIVIRIDGERTSDPDNLFICASMSEYGRIRTGSLPWPSHSNLSTYADRVPTSATET